MCVRVCNHLPISPFIGSRACWLIPNDHVSFRDCVWPMSMSMNTLPSQQAIEVYCTAMVQWLHAPHTHTHTSQTFVFELFFHALFLSHLLSVHRGWPRRTLPITHRTHLDHIILLTITSVGGTCIFWLRIEPEMNSQNSVRITHAHPNHLKCVIHICLARFIFFARAHQPWCLHIKQEDIAPSF